MNTPPVPDTVNPPVEHVVGDAYDPLGITYSTNGGAFTPAPFDNGDGLSQSLFGPPRFYKDGWWACFEGLFTIPVGSSNINIDICTLPVAYAKPARRGAIISAKTGIWGGVFGNATAILNGRIVNFRDDGMHLANANFGYVHAVWMTQTYGEPGA